MTKQFFSSLYNALALVLCLAVTGFCMPASATTFEWHPNARLHLDYADYNPDVEQLADDWIVRRAKVGLEGKIGSDWEFEIEYAMASNDNIRPDEGKLEDVVLVYEGWSVGDISVGQFKLPFGLEEAISSNDIIFMERALPVDAFTLSRRLGIGFGRARSAYTFHAMVFGRSIDDDADDDGHGMAARFTLAPIHTARTVLHFGIAGVTENPIGTVDIDTAPESRVADEDLVNTGDLAGVDRINRLGLESAWRTGPYSIQAEWMQARIQRDSGFADTSLEGWYVGGSWVLTGEERPYEDGQFKGIEPASAWGAVELVARYSRINLDDGPVRGGKEHNITLGLNYYLNEHFRAMLEYIHVDSRRHGQSDNPDVVTMRLQFVL